MRGKIRLGDTATFVNGYPFKPETWTETGLPIIRIQNLNNPEAPYNHYFGSVPEKYLVRRGDILISWSASLGAYEWKGDDAYLNQHIFKVVFDKSPIDKHYLRYAVESKLAEMEKDAHGATMRHIVKKDFDNTLIPYPPFQEQEKIVAELDCLSGIIEKKKVQLEELDKLAQSIFYDMFGDPITNEKGWPVKKLGSFSNSELGKMLDVKKNKGELRPYLCSINVQWGRFELNPLKQMGFENDELERYSVRKGDLLICEGGDTGRCAIWKEDYTIYYQNALHRVRFDEKVMLPIVCQFVMKAYKDNGEMDKYSKGQTIKHLVKKTLLSIPMIAPPLGLQNEFAQKIEAIERQKDLVKRSIVETETLFNSRMDYWFN